MSELRSYGLQTPRGCSESISELRMTGKDSPQCLDLDGFAGLEVVAVRVLADHAVGVVNRSKDVYGGFHHGRPAMRNAVVTPVIEGGHHRIFQQLVEGTGF